MENFENNVHEEQSLISNLEINGYLMETSRWGKFLAIVGYIGMGLLIILGFVMMFGLSSFNKIPLQGFKLMIGLVYILMAVLYYFPVTYLYNFSIQIRKGIESSDSATVVSGFKNLKSLFRFMGILAIVILSIYGLVLMIAVPSILFFHH